MRGKLTFRKIIQRMPSGKFRWAINGDFDTTVASGVALNKRMARKNAMAEERRLIGQYDQARENVQAMRASPSYSFPARHRAECRDICNRKSQQ